MTLLFLHGAGCTGAVFGAQTAALDGAHAPDLPGHGTPGAPASIAEFAAAMAQYAQREGLQDLVLCGHSMGAAIALQMALDRLVPVRALILLGAGARLRVAPEILEGLAADFDAASRRLAGYFFAEPSPERVGAAVASMRAVGQAQTLRDFRACDAFDVTGRLGELSLPLLALTGEADRMTPPKYAEFLAGRVPGAAARIVPGAGHFVMTERPEETNREIAAFLQGIA